MKCSTFDLRGRMVRCHLHQWLKRRPFRISCSAVDVVDTRVRVKFIVPHHVEFGQSVCVIGSAPELGSWAVEKSHPLTWNEGDIWSGIVEMSPDDVQYKYFTLNADGTPADWQPFEGNRTAEVSEGKDLVIHDDWNHTFRDSDVITVPETDAEEPMPISDDVTLDEILVSIPSQETKTTSAEDETMAAKPSVPFS